METFKVGYSRLANWDENQVFPEINIEPTSEPWVVEGKVYLFW